MERGALDPLMMIGSGGVVSVVSLSRRVRLYAASVKDLEPLIMVGTVKDLDPLIMAGAGWVVSRDDCSVAAGSTAPGRGMRSQLKAPAR